MWFRIFISFCGLFTVIFITVYIVKVFYSGQLLLKLSRCLLLLAMMGSIFCAVIKLLFYSVTGTKRGLETNNIFGSNKIVKWDEIMEVRRPRFGIPNDFSYVISGKTEKLLLIRSMKNYKELIQLIKERAINLTKCKY